jgi:hypothetical protein
MRQNHTARRVALGLLLGSVAIPAAAQQTQPITPPVLTPVPPPAETPAPAPAASPSITFAPQAPVVQAVPPPPAPPPEAAATEAPAPRAIVTRQRTTRVEQRATRAAAAVPAPTAAASPAAPAPVPTPVASPAAPEAAATPAPAPVATPAPAAAPAKEEMSSAAAWAMLAIPVLAILALIAFAVSRRRRASADTYEETYYEPVEETPIAVEPAAYAAPVAAVVGDEATGRPWIDIGLRPIRAEDSLEVEVTVSNSGDAPAHGVRVSTWMLNGTESSEGEQALIEARSGAQIATVDVAAGDDRSVDTTVALPNDAATPILVAEARYPLPLGGEGRIAATFEIDVTEGDVEARLHDVLERA